MDATTLMLAFLMAAAVLLFAAASACTKVRPLAPEQANVCTALLEIVELHKLNDISLTGLALGVAENDIISI